jgi:UDP-N-acetyl-D-glucosamine dehydrogenase
VRTAGLRSAVLAHRASVGVIGQGYVGLTVAAAAAAAGFRVHAVDVDDDRIRSLSDGDNVVPGVPDDLFALGHATGRLTFGTTMAGLADSDVVLICVPTPVVDNRPDLRHVTAAATALGEVLRRDTLVVLESTTYPGTTDEVVRPLLERPDRTAGRDFLLAYSPERIDPGNVKFGLRNTPRVVGGHTPAAAEVAAAFYRQLVDEVLVVSDCRSAEMAKLLENTFRMVNIALVNELATICAAQGIDVWEVIAAAASKPFGFLRFEPGPGVGGHCIPLDPTYLTWQSRRDAGKPFRLVETAADINAAMPAYVAARVGAALNDHGLAVRGARILALGVTYKPDVGDIRESAAIRVLGELSRGGARIRFHDPYVATVDLHGRQVRRSALTRSAVEEADCVLLLSAHSTYDLADLAGRSSLFFDARGSLRHRELPQVVSL